MSQSTVIKYQPALRKIAGSLSATVLMSQLEYWFSKQGRAFYKFIEPCDHKLYKEGDSWSEELAFSGAEFRNAFKQIGVVYKTKKAYRESEDRFQGKMYLSYFDRVRKVTYYMRNDKLVENVFNALASKSIEEKSPAEEKQQMPLEEMNTSQLQERLASQESEKEKLLEMHKVDPYRAVESEGGISVDYVRKLQTEKYIKTNRLIDRQFPKVLEKKLGKEETTKSNDKFVGGWDIEELERMEEDYIEGFLRSRNLREVGYEELSRRYVKDLFLEK